jgi:hypothetical protein
MMKLNLFIATLVIMVLLSVSEVHVLGADYRTLYTSQNLNGFDEIVLFIKKLEREGGWRMVLSIRLIRKVVENETFLKKLGVAVR